MKIMVLDMANKSRVLRGDYNMIKREKILQWFEIEHDLYEENGYIFVVDIDLFNNQMSYYYKTTDKDGTEYYQFLHKDIYNAIELFNEVLERDV